MKKPPSHVVFLRLFLLATALLFTFLSQTHAAVLVKYQFPSGAATPTSSVSEVNASNVTTGLFIGGTLGTTHGFSSGAGNAYSRVTLSGGGGPLLGSTESAAVSNGDYFQFTITPTGAALNLSSLTAQVGGQKLNQNTTADYTTTYFIRSSLDGYSSNLGTASLLIQSSGSSGSGTTQYTTLTADLSAAAFQNVTEAVTFRLYLYAETSTKSYDQTLRITDIMINGNVATIPEPSAWAMLILGAGFLFYFRRSSLSSQNLAGGMKRGLSVALLFSGMASAVYAGEIALVNPGFEDEMKGWIVSPSDNGKSYVTAEAAHSGSFGLQVDDDDDTTGSELRSKLVRAIPGKEHELRFFAKPLRGEGIGVYLVFFDIDRQPLDTPENKKGILLVLPKGPSEWKECRLTGLAPSDAAYVMVRVHSFLKSKVSAQMDDFSLSVVE